MIPYGKQIISQKDIDAVLEVLQSDFLTQGPKVPAFEQKVCSMVGANYAFATSNATAALHIACLALGVTENDRVWTSPNTFVASANCALYCNAAVDFVDIDTETGNMSTDALSEKLKQAEANDALPKVVIPVHFAGQSCDMKAIHQLSQQYGFKIIEDASHAIGGRYDGQLVGNCRYSDICVFSFHPVKIVPTAEGGMALTNDEAIAQNLALYRSHGVTRDSHLLRDKDQGPWFYEQLALGFNYRMTELQAALGLSQLENLSQWIESRNSLAKNYNQMFDCVEDVHPLRVDTNNTSAYHLYVIRVESSKRRALFEFLRENKIGVNVHYIPVYKQPFYQDLGFIDNYCPNTEAYYSGAITLPLHPSLSQDEQSFIVEKVKEGLCNLD